MSRKTSRGGATALGVLVLVAVAGRTSVAGASNDEPPEGGGSWSGRPSRVTNLSDEMALDLGGTVLEVRRIPKGTFVQGSPANEPGREADESPARKVTISRTFWLGKVPITRGQFTRFVGETRHVTDAEKGQSGGFGVDPKTGTLVQKKEFSWRNPGFAQKEEDPVVLVTFGDATAFVAWASRKTGRRVRLPTEAEWEYAARGGSTTPWYGGSKEEEASTLGWFKTNAGGTTHPVGLKKPNDLGLFDMAGNVHQWCRDIYAPYPPGDVVDPETTTNSGTDPERRVLRGGSFLRDPKRGRSAARHKNTPGSRNADNGFRVAVDDDPTLAPSASALPDDFAPASPVPLGSIRPDAGGPVPPTVTPPARTSSGESGFGWALLAAPAAGAAAVTAWVLARRKRHAPNAQGITTRAQDDGFWVRAPNVSAGSRVRYSCLVQGVEVSDVVPLDGAEETFVYTGARPSAIRITEVIAAPPQGYRVREPSSPMGPPTPAPLTPRPPPPPSARPRPLDRDRDLDVVPLVIPLPSPAPPPAEAPAAPDDAPFAGHPRAY